MSDVVKGDLDTEITGCGSLVGARCERSDFVAHVDVSRIVPELPEHEEGRASRPGDEVVAFRCAVRVACALCGASLGFRVPDVGDLPDRPAVSPDALELRVPLISPAELEVLGPLAAMQQGDGLAGFQREGATMTVPRTTPPESLLAVRALAERWEAEAAEYETRALPENARSVDYRVEDSRRAARLRLRASELREALGE